MYFINVYTVNGRFHKLHFTVIYKWIYMICILLTQYEDESIFNNQISKRNVTKESRDEVELEGVIHQEWVKGGGGNVFVKCGGGKIR